MVVDPNQPEKGVFTAFFSIPTSCSCSLGEENPVASPKSDVYDYTESTIPEGIPGKLKYPRSIFTTEIVYFLDFNFRKNVKRIPNRDKPLAASTVPTLFEETSPNVRNVMRGTTSASPIPTGSSRFKIHDEFNQVTGKQEKHLEQKGKICQGKSGWGKGDFSLPSLLTNGRSSGPKPPDMVCKG